MGSGPGYEVGRDGMGKGGGIGTRALLTDPPREGGSEGRRDGLLAWGEMAADRHPPLPPIDLHLIFDEITRPRWEKGGLKSEKKKVAEVCEFEERRGLGGQYPPSYNFDCNCVGFCRCVSK